MQQLALDIRLADYAVFETFHAGPNAASFESVRRTAEGRGGAPIIWLWGAAGSGKSHLLQASVASAHEHTRTAYVPFDVLRDRDSALLDGMGNLELVALDDIGAVAGNGEWERALLRLYEELLSGGGRLLLANELPPASSGFRLPDLASRFCAAAVFRLERLADDDCLSALQKRAAWRGFSLPDETGRFLMARVERDTGSLFRLLDRLDREALAAQRRLTVPFVRSVLDALSGDP